MSIERFVWTKRFFIPRALPCFTIPRMVAESEARSTLYHLEGMNRSSECEQFVFQYSLSGRGSFMKRGRRHSVAAGSGFLVEVSDPDVTYCYPEDTNEPWRFIFINFSDAGGMAQSMTQQLGHVFHLPLEDPLIQRLRGFGSFRESTIELTAGEGHLLIHGILSRLADGARSDLPEMTQVRLIRQAERLIRDHLDSPYNAGILANDLGITHEHLCRVFKSELGTTPLAFLNDTKIRIACERLRTTSMSCRDVAESLGYAPGSHFARLFKRITGMTPREFRKRGIISF